MGADCPLCSHEVLVCPLLGMMAACRGGAAAAFAPLALDVDDAQVTMDFFDDPNFHWHALAVYEVIRAQALLKWKRSTCRSPRSVVELRLLRASLGSTHLRHEAQLLAG